MRQQQLLTLDILHQHQLITDDQYQQAASEPVQPSLWRVEYAGSGAELMVARASRNPDYRSDPDPAWTLQALVKRELQQSGISPARAATVTLTIDAQAQRDLNDRVTQNRANVGEGAAVVNVADGGILALASSTGGSLSGDAGSAVGRDRPPQRGQHRQAAALLGGLRARRGQLDPAQPSFVTNRPATTGRPSATAPTPSSTSA